MDGSRLLRRLGPVLACALAMCAVAPPPASAQADNDNFGGAFLMSFNDDDGLTDTSAGTTEPGETLTCATSGTTTSHTYWWWFPGSGRNVTVSTAGSTFDTTLAIFDSTRNQLLCDDSAANGTDAITFLSELDKLYYVQVGGCAQPGNLCGAATGGIGLLATTPPPANDNRAAATPLPTGVQKAGENFGSTEEPGEATSCTTSSGPVTFGRTVWYSWHAPSTGTATFTLIGAFDPVLAIYRGSPPTALVCDHPATTSSTARVQIAVTSGDYLVEVAGFGPHAPANFTDSDEDVHTLQADFTETPDRDGDGVLNGQDCAPDNAAIHPGATETPGNKIDEDCSGADGPAGDRDADGTPDARDCAPDNAAVHPGAKDVRGNKVDEDCSGADAAIAIVAANLSPTTFATFPVSHYTRMRLVAANVPAGARIEIRCSGHGCPFHRKVTTSRRGARRLALGGRALRRAKLRPGAVIQVRITKAGRIGRVTIYRIRAGQAPAEQHRCLPPGASRPVACNG